jgi:hypothetical protein
MVRSWFWFQELFVFAFGSAHNGWAQVGQSVGLDWMREYKWDRVLAGNAFSKFFDFVS